MDVRGVSRSTPDSSLGLGIRVGGLRLSVWIWIWGFRVTSLGLNA
jgi:hypothetical protein